MKTFRDVLDHLKVFIAEQVKVQILIQELVTTLKKFLETFFRKYKAKALTQVKVKDRGVVDYKTKTIRKRRKNAKSKPYIKKRSSKVASIIKYGIALFPKRALGIAMFALRKLSLPITTAIAATEIYRGIMSRRHEMMSLEKKGLTKKEAYLIVSKRHDAKIVKRAEQIPFLKSLTSTLQGLSDSVRKKFGIRSDRAIMSDSVNKRMHKKYEFKDGIPVITKGSLSDTLLEATRIAEEYAKVGNYAKAAKIMKTYDVFGPSISTGMTRPEMSSPGYWEKMYPPDFRTKTKRPVPNKIRYTVPAKKERPKFLINGPSNATNIKSINYDNSIFSKSKNLIIVPRNNIRKSVTSTTENIFYPNEQTSNVMI